MQSDKKKSREDTWTTEELKKHVVVGHPDVHQEDKRLKERRHHRDESSGRRKDSRARNNEKERKHDKDIHRNADNDSERRREGYKEKDKESHKERDARKERDREKIGDKEKDKYQRAEKGKDRESERKSKQRDVHVEFEDNEKMYNYMDEEKRRRESGEISERKRVADRERRHKERNEKEETTRENSGSKDKYIRSLEHKDEKREKRHTSMIEKELMLTGKERERRHRDKKDHENADKKQRHRQEDNSEDNGEKKTRTLKDGRVEHVERNLEEKINERRHGDGASLNASGERRHKEKRERVQREEHKRSKDHTEESKYRRREKSEGHNVDIVSRYARLEEGDQKNHMMEREGKQIEEIEKEEIIIDSQISPDAVYEDFSGNYEEDFEAYDDDFEDEEEEFRDEEDQPRLKQEEMAIYKTAEMEEIQRAINAENDLISAIPSRHSRKSYEKDQGKEFSNLQKKESHRGVFIDFMAAKQRQISRKMAEKQKKRSTELLRLIDMDFSITLSLLDLSPVNEYDMYIRSFGKTNTKQAYVQCNEDYVDRDIQTEEVETEERWTQYPGEGTRVCGSSTNTDGAFADAASLPKVDSQRLSQFLRSACQVVAVLLEEDYAEKQSSWKLGSQEASLSISDGCFQLNMNLSFLHDRKVYNLLFSQVQRHVMLSVHGLPESPGDDRLNNKYIICVWNIWEPSTPLKLLLCDSEIKCCCFSPGKATLVFAGTMDGSVVVWDLREDSSMHHCMTVADSNWVFRSSTFSTDGVLTSVNHVCPVLAIEPISTTVVKEGSLANLTSEEEMLGLSFQMASLDENGYLNLWVVMELQKVDVAGSQSDLGLIPGGKVKLVHSSTINLLDSFFSKDIICRCVPQTLNIKFLPLDSNHYIVGTDIGLVCHGTRHGTRVPPKLYKPQQRGTRPIKVTAVDFSPFGEPIFLVGCSDGSIRLHLMSDEYPIMHWNDCTNGQPIIDLQWSLTKPSVFFVLDSASSIYIWDLLQSDLQFVVKDTLRSDRVITMAVFGEPEKNNGLSGLALAKESGTLEVQYVKRKWATSHPEEANQLHLLLHEAL
ncbi:cytoplasmic dynein 2 intermediate chain 1 isoform X2 [Ambystoma mexicanum]|uniref:cytoplasmic dynein 2 intermediate chain 1 isoform X2 n=1 Tax=Ambystoma mexicanum TaxID=8296 RepID=UPI0037E7436D